MQLTCSVHVPLKFLCGLASPFVVLSIVWQPGLNQETEQVSLVSFAKAMERSTIKKTEARHSSKWLWFGFFWGVGVVFLYYSSKFKILNILTSDILQSQTLFCTVNYAKLFE